MIVVDTNLIAYLFITSDQSILAERLLRHDPDWSAPMLWRSEFRNVLSTTVRQTPLTVDDAIAIMSQAELLLNGREYTLPSAAVLRLAAKSGCSAYDAEFAALARDLAVPFITADRPLLRRLPGLALAPARFLAGS